jgi:hypothetical protein
MAQQRLHALKGLIPMSMDEFILFQPMAATIEADKFGAMNPMAQRRAP